MTLWLMGDALTARDRVFGSSDGRFLSHSVSFRLCSFNCHGCEVVEHRPRVGLVGPPFTYITRGLGEYHPLDDKTLLSPAADEASPQHSSRTRSWYWPSTYALNISFRIDQVRKQEG